MDATPTAGQSPTGRDRGKSSAIRTKVDSPETRIKPARRRKASAQSESTLDRSDLSQTIATTAYFLAAARNFEPGRELEDWFEAERRVRAAAQ
jgi:hypothetical protein